MPPVGELRQCVAVGMKDGGRFRLRMDNDAAPVTVGEFLRNALDAHIYDRHTLHRVEPNFVVQGGSPGGNEYSSALTRFMRDEIEQRNDRGAVGLSTRGRNTADGQIYIMLVDDPRLDGRFTIFAHVFPADMPFVDGIQEGEEIARVTPTACDGSR
jgi:cyclophilin family peptidyl-prolyl cis-trans isomerase